MKLDNLKSITDLEKTQRMKLTTKGRYAVTAMLDLTLHNEDRATTLADIADRQGISLSYLEQLFARLRKKGLVISVRGPGGGYKLSLPPTEISVANIIKSVDENLDSTGCGGAKNCKNEKACLTHDLWIELSNSIYDFLNGVSLQDLIDKQDKTKITDILNTKPKKNRPGAEFLMSSVRP